MSVELSDVMCCELCCVSVCVECCDVMSVECDVLCNELRELSVDVM